MKIQKTISQKEFFQKTEEFFQKMSLSLSDTLFTYKGRQIAPHFVHKVATSQADVV